MRINQNKPSYPDKTGVKKAKEIQELQNAWEKTAQKLKNSPNQEDQLLYSFLKANYIDSHTHLITSKQKQESHSISCKAKDFRHSNQSR